MKNRSPLASGGSSAARRRRMSGSPPYRQSGRRKNGTEWSRRGKFRLLIYQLAAIY